MPRNLLPRLRRAPTPANVQMSKVAEWTDVGTPEELGKLDFGVAPGGDDVRQRVQSIPSPWARLLLFRAAMDDPGHPARRLVENELLDAFQFLWSRNERPNVPLEAATVRVEEIEAMAREAGTQRAEWFGRALTELMPRRAEDGGRSAPAFEAVSVVSVNGRPVLGSSPYTVLFTAEDAAALPVNETGAYFRYAAGDGTRAEPRALHQRPFAFQRFVAQVLLPQLDQLGNGAEGNTDGAAVQRLLKRWLADQVRVCRVHAGSPARQAQLDAPVTHDWRAAAAALNLEPVAGLTGRVALFARPAGDEMRESRWLLRPGRAGVRAPVVVHRAEFDGRYVPNGPAVTLPQHLDAQRDVLPGTATSHPWVSPADDWFTENLLVLSAPLRPEGVFGFAGPRNFTSQYSGPAAHLRAPQFALPLRREVLRYFTPQEVEQRLSVEVQPTGQVLVTLRLPVGPEDAEVQVQRRYDESAIARVRGPELVLWPNFQSDRWRDYLLFQQDPAGQAVRPLRVHAARAGELLPQDAEQRGDAVYVSAFDQAPEAVEFTDGVSGAAEPRRLGLVLPRYAPVGASSQQTWRVGVDFGTSNTVVSRSAGGREEILRAEGLTLPLTEQRAASALRNLDAYFFPAGLAPQPFGTALVRQLQLPSFNLERERVGLRANVPFSGFVEHDARNRVVGDLKWSTSPEQQFLTSAFLRHVLAVVLAEAVRDGVDPASVTVTYSYPRAFTRPQVNQLAALWLQVREYFDQRLRATGAGAADQPAGVGPVTQGPDESRAVLRYFFNAGKLSAAGDVNVVVDVGGGTADVAMYGRGATLALDSVMLGGRNLTGARLQAGDAEQRGNPFVAQFVAWSRQHHLGDSPDVRRAVDKYLEDRQDHLAFGYLLQSDWYRAHGRAFSSDPACHAFQGLALYFFGALFYYVGLSLRGVAERRGAEAATLVPSTVVLAGNGSRYVDWLTDLIPVTAGASGVFEPFARLLSRTLLAGMGLGGDARGPEVGVTPRAKLEVALGLVAGVSPAGLNEDAAEQCPAVGERVRVAVGEKREVRDFLPTSRLALDELLYADGVASLTWGEDRLEVERFHEVLHAEMARLAEPGSPWVDTRRRMAGLFERLQRRELQQQTVQLLEYLASRNDGFHGSLFLAEATTVLNRMLDGWFVPAGPGAPPPRAAAAR